MHLVTFQHDGHSRLGALYERGGQALVVDLNAEDPRVPDNILDFLKAGDAVQTLARELVQAVPTAAVYEQKSVTLKAVIPNPGKIICIGLNYRDHAAETNQALPQVPIVFAKYDNTIVGPGDPIILPQ